MDSTQSAQHKRLAETAELAMNALSRARTQSTKPLQNWGIICELRPFMADQRRQSICTSLTAGVHATLEGQVLRHQIGQTKIESRPSRSDR